MERRRIVLIYGTPPDCQAPDCAKHNAIYYTRRPRRPRDQSAIGRMPRAGGGAAKRRRAPESAARRRPRPRLQRTDPAPQRPAAPSPTSPLARRTRRRRRRRRRLRIRIAAPSRARRDGARQVPVRTLQLGSKTPAAAAPRGPTGGRAGQSGPPPAAAPPRSRGRAARA